MWVGGLRCPFRAGGLEKCHINLPAWAGILFTYHVFPAGGGQRLVDFSYLDHRRKYDVTSGEKILLRSSELGSVLARRSAMS